MFSAEINRCYIFGGCVLCVVYFLDLLTVYVAAFLVISVAGVNYYLRQREENFRHRLRILGLIKHDKRERKSKTEHNSSQRVLSRGSATRRSSNASRTYDSSYEYACVVPGNKFETTSQSLSRSEVNGDYYSCASPVSRAKNVDFDRLGQSSFTSDHARKSQLDWAPPAARRHPIQQERYSVGSYPTVCLSKSPLPVARPFTSPEVIAPVKVKILPLASSPRLSSSFSQQRTSGGEIDKQDPCSTESVIQALKERRKRAAAAAYRDSLEVAELGMPQHSSKRLRMDSLCGMGSPMPSFMPVATSVGGLGPPFHAPSSPKRAGEGAFKRARLPSTTSLSKRQRNNAIFMSYCSSRTVPETGQLQKRKAASAARETPPRSKFARNEDGVSDASTPSERVDDSAGESTGPTPADRSTPDPSRNDKRISRPRRDALPSNQSIRNKRLVFPEHVATLEEHESDRAMDQKHLRRMLGSIQDVYQTSQGKATVISSQPSVDNSTGTTVHFSLPFSIASTTTSPISQESTKAVSAISSPLMSVSSSPTKQLAHTPAGHTVPEGAAAVAVTSSSPLLLAKVPPTTEACMAPNPLLGAPLSIVTASETARVLKLPASVPILATSTTASTLLGGSSSLPLSSSNTSAKVQLPAPITSLAPAAISTSSSDPPLNKPSSIGGFGATATSGAVPPITFGAQTFKMNGPSTTGTSTTFGATPNLTLTSSAASPFKFGASAVAATTVTPASLPSFGSTVLTSSLPTLPTATTTLQRGTSGGFAFDARVSAVQTPSLPTPSTATTVLKQSTSGGFAFGTSLATTTGSVASSFGSTASSSSGPAFKFGASSTQSAPNLAQQPVPAFSTTPTSLPAFSKSSPFAFGTAPTTTKTESVTAPYAFGKSLVSSSSPANHQSSFGVPATSSFVLGSSLTSHQAPTTTPLFPSAVSASQPLGGTAVTASQSGFQFGALAASRCQSSSGTTATASQGGFQFPSAPSMNQPSGGTTLSASKSGFQFGVQSANTGQASDSATASTSQGGFQFGVPQSGFGFTATNGLTNGVSSSIASSQSAGVFKFGGSVNSTLPITAPSSFNFMNSQCGPSLASSPAFNFGAQAANNSLFSIGAAASHNERPIARPRSKRITKK